MTGRDSDFFRNYGIIPFAVSAPREQKIRAYFPFVHIFGQYLATAILGGLGIGMSILCGALSSFPANVLGPIVILPSFGAFVFFVTRNDYSWVELDGSTVRAKHMYTQRIVECSIEEIDDLLTLYFKIQTKETIVAEYLLGRVRGIMIRFRDQRTPIQVCRTDPTMRNAKELIEAIVYRMSQRGELDIEMELEGKPIIRRIYWKSPPPLSTERTAHPSL